MDSPMKENEFENSKIVSQPSTQPLTDINVINEGVALNLLVSFLNLANKRGTFSLEEASKIWDCVKLFKR